MAITNPTPQPKEVVILQREDGNAYYEEVHISGSNKIIYIDASGYLNADDSASFYTVFPPAGGSGGSSTASLNVYSTIVSNSGNWITASFLNSDQYITINSGALYNFTCSNIPSVNTASNLSLFINNLAIVTCSLAFPSDWVFMGNTPLSLSSSRAAVLSLKNYGGTKMVAAFAVQY